MAAQGYQNSKERTASTSTIFSENTSSIHEKSHYAKAKARPIDGVQLDPGEVQIRRRTKWWKVWIPRSPPPPSPRYLSDAPYLPLGNASTFSVLTYAWVTPIMTLGYQRTLQAPDLWKLDEAHSSNSLAHSFNQSWQRRTLQANYWNSGLEQGLIHPSTYRRLVWNLQSIFAGRNYRSRRSSLEEHWRLVGGRMKPSLALALNDTLGFFFWSGGMFKVFGDVSQLMGPLLVKAIINFSLKREAAKATGEPPPGIGNGLVMAAALFLITVFASIGQHQFFWRSMVTGVLARSALIKSIYQRGMTLTGKARSKLSNSDLMNHISTDVSRIDNCAQWFHAMWTAPIQIIICLIILLSQLGPSALAGFALFFAIVPLQKCIMAGQYKQRKKSMKYTAKRASILLEVLESMRGVKYFSYESPFLKRIHKIRTDELKGIKAILICQSANLALATSPAVLAATVTFVTYTHFVPRFDVAVIFASLSLFQLLQQPMMFMPRALSLVVDARSALDRLHTVFNAETRTCDPIVADPNLKWALQAENVTFEWETPLAIETDAPCDNTTTTPATPFRIENITMHIQRGSLVAIVGPVGSGKSSLVSGFIGEMRKESGSFSFGGRVAYCAQTAWIQNASLRENILFGRPFDEERYWRVIEQCCLLPDLELLPDGDLTEIGEKGINLSGGQKQRINMARAVYFDADIVILDDPLSAVDAHVGKSLFHSVILGALRNQGKSVIFVTHAWHFLSYCDYIYTLREGRLAEQGTFQELVDAGGEFARLDQEFGGGALEYPDSDQERSKPAAEGTIMKLTAISKQAIGTGRLEGGLIAKERRSTGVVSGQVYKTYLQAGFGIFTVTFIILAVILVQSSMVLGSYTLVWWSANSFNRPFSFYQTLYAMLGLSQAAAAFLLGFSTDIFSHFVSRNLHHAGVFNVFHAPMSFFDTTPIGRIIGVFGKDMDSIDNQLPSALRMLALTLSSLLGSIIIITIVEHYFIIAAVLIFLGYYYFAAFYRASAREVQRLDSMLRSLLYSHMSESLTGVPTLRSYGEIPRFLKENEGYIDLENRALFLTVTNQRWLAIRLDFCGALLVLLVALFAVLDLSGRSAAQIGLVLTYTTTLTQICGVLTRQTAEVENHLNSVERVVQFSRRELIEQEAPHECPEQKPPQEWPDRGSIEVKDLFLRYRPGLPHVLHGISMSIRGGEKIGIVGRTGAGKSSITLALLRIVEYTGSILIDGVDISKIGLMDLRTKLSIIPQDPTIFGGTVRTALDPFSLYDDACLWDALRRSYLVDSDAKDNSDTGTRVTLDTVIESGGSNFSVGERSLLSLARALVRNSRVAILDEATASVDLETDQKIQRTIQTEFKDRTLICIAHRLRTILSYDRILVLDGGNIAEFDTPLTLFRNMEGVFRGLCEQSGITQSDIEQHQSPDQL